MTDENKEKETKPSDVRTTSFTSNIVPLINEEVAVRTIDRLMGAAGSLIRQSIASGELTSAVVILSTAGGKVASVIFDKCLDTDDGVNGLVVYQSDKLACASMAKAVVTSLSEEVLNTSKTFAKLVER